MTSVYILKSDDNGVVLSRAKTPESAIEQVQNGVTAEHPSSGPLTIEQAESDLNEWVDESMCLW